MKTIYKYNLHTSDQVITLPRPGKVVHLDYDGRGGVDLWVEVDTSTHHMYKRFRTFGTGHEIPDKSEYVGTIREPDPLSDLIWHVYEVPL